MAATILGVVLHVVFCKPQEKYIYVDRYITETQNEDKTEETAEEATTEETATVEGAKASATGANKSKGYYHPETIAAEAAKFDAEHGIVSLKDEAHTTKSASEKFSANDAENKETTFQKESGDVSGIEASNNNETNAEDNKDEHENQKPAIDLNKEANVKDVTSNEAPKTEEKTVQPTPAESKKLDDMLAQTKDTSKQASGNVATQELEVKTPEKEEKAPEAKKAPANTNAQAEKPAKTLSANQIGSAFVGGQLQIQINSNSHKDVTVNGKKFSGNVFTDNCGDEATVKTYVIEDGTNTVVVNVAVNAIL